MIYDGADGGVLCMKVGETVWNTLEGVGIEKRGQKKKILKRWQAGSSGGCLKKGGGGNPLANYD